ATRIGEARLACETIVLATGPWVCQTQRWLGSSLPIEPVKGEMLRMRLPGEGLRLDLSHGDISLYRRGEGAGVGGGGEEAGEPGILDEARSEEGRARLMAGAMRILPGMERAELLEHCAAVRPQGPSGLPILGRLSEWENVFVANGGGIKGILLCTGMAQAMQELLVHGGARMATAFQAA